MIDLAGTGGAMPLALGNRGGGAEISVSRDLQRKRLRLIFEGIPPPASTISATRATSVDNRGNDTSYCSVAGHRSLPLSADLFNAFVCLFAVFVSATLENWM